jgi:hypothetical protein
MFRKNTAHTQPALLSAIQDLPARQRERLEQSWAGTFYREFFCRVNEAAFAVLYSEEPSRPNVPVNVLVGLEALKSGFGWSDEELYDAFLYNLQVRYALGYDRLGDGEFQLRTLYYFRQRLSQYNLAHGVNVLAQAFEHITDQQIVALKVRTGLQRMDSVQIASNILDASRLHLLVEGLLRLHRLADETDRQRLADWFAPYLKESAQHYTYRVKGKEATQAHVQQVGQALWAVLQAWQVTCASEPMYQTVERLFQENFHIVEETVRAKANAELPATCLQSLDDVDATYRTKANVQYKGYVANVTETCDPDNAVQLITKVQVAPNHTEDAQLLHDALPNLKARTDLATLVTDGAYPSPENDVALRQHGVSLIPTSLRGTKPDPDRFALADFQIEQNAQGEPMGLRCPQGHCAPVTPGDTSGWFARFAVDACQTCPFQLTHRCRAKPQRRDPRYYLDFTLVEMYVALRRQACEAHRHGPHNLRAAVEATVRSVKHSFPAAKVPVRGRFRVTCMLVASAICVNVRRIRAFQVKLVAQSRSGGSLNNFLHARFWLRILLWWTEPQKSPVLA